MKYLPWEDMRRAFETEGLSCHEIAARFGVGYSTVTKHARQEGWLPGHAATAETMPALVERLSDTVMEVLEAERQKERPDIHSVKELTAMLRELANMRKALESRETGETTVRVVLAPEIEAWSR